MAFHLISAKKLAEKLAEKLQRKFFVLTQYQRLTEFYRQQKLQNGGDYGF